MAGKFENKKCNLTKISNFLSKVFFLEKFIANNLLYFYNNMKKSCLVIGSVEDMVLYIYFFVSRKEFS